MHSTCPAYLILFDVVIITILGEASNYEVPHYAIFAIQDMSSLSGPNILLSNLESHPYKTTGKIKGLYSLIIMF
jgi:hypothetical protein